MKNVLYVLFVIAISTSIAFAGSEEKIVLNKDVQTLTVTIPRLPAGDFNENGKLDLGDSSGILQHLTGIISEAETQISSCEAQNLTLTEQLQAARQEITQLQFQIATSALKDFETRILEVNGEFNASDFIPDWAKLVRISSSEDLKMELYAGSRKISEGSFLALSSVSKTLKVIGNGTFKLRFQSR
jgi:uncharacterized UPF0160 family protein